MGIAENSPRTLFGSVRFWIKSIQLTWPTPHEQHQAAFGSTESWHLTDARGDRLAFEVRSVNGGQQTARQRTCLARRPPDNRLAVPADSTARLSRPPERWLCPCPIALKSVKRWSDVKQRSGKSHETGRFHAGDRNCEAGCGNRFKTCSGKTAQFPQEGCSKE